MGILDRIKEMFGGKTKDERVDEVEATSPSAVTPEEIEKNAAAAEKYTGTDAEKQA